MTVDSRMPELSQSPNFSKRPGTFDEDGEKFFEELDPWAQKANDIAEEINTTQGQINTTQGEVNTAKAAAEEAASIAQNVVAALNNFEGAWVNLTGPLDEGVAVTHAGNYWASTKPIAAVENSEPAFGNSDWTILSNNTPKDLFIVNLGTVSTNQILDCSLYNYFIVSPTAAVTLTFSNIGVGMACIVQITNVADYPPTYAGGTFIWATDDGLASAESTGDTASLYKFVSPDGVNIIAEEINVGLAI